MRGDCQSSALQSSTRDSQCRSDRQLIGAWATLPAKSMGRGSQCSSNRQLTRGRATLPAKSKGRIGDSAGGEGFQDDAGAAGMRV